MDKVCTCDVQGVENFNNIIKKKDFINLFSVILWLSFMSSFNYASIFQIHVVL